MLCLFETPAGFALFKVLQEKKLKDLPSLWQEFTTPDKAAELVKLKAFTKFEDTTDALAAVANLVRLALVVVAVLARMSCSHAKVVFCSRCCAWAVHSV